MAKEVSHRVYAGLSTLSPSPHHLDIIPAQCYTKAQYAKHINKSATWVNELIKQGKLTEIAINGGSFVMENQ